jgi:hypothetical protein
LDEINVQLLENQKDNLKQQWIMVRSLGLKSRSLNDDGREKKSCCRSASFQGSGGALLLVMMDGTLFFCGVFESRSSIEGPGKRVNG